MIPGTTILTDMATTTTHMDGTGVWDFHMAIPDGALAFHTGIHIIIHHGTLRGIIIHIGEGHGTEVIMDITEDITAITTEIITDIIIMTITDLTEGHILEEVIQYQEITGQEGPYQIQGLQHSRESHVT